MSTAELTRPALDMQDIDQLVKHGHRRRHPKNGLILEPGDNSDSLFYVVDGTATVSIQSDEGREIILAYLNPGAFIGEIGLFYPDTPREAYVRAKTDCELIQVDYTEFRELARQMPDLLFAINRQLTRRLTQATKKVGNLAFLDVAGRVASTLIDLCKQPDAMTHPDGMQIKITRQEIGRIVGYSREMVGRVLKELEAKGLVDVAGKTMVVHGTR